MSNIEELQRRITAAMDRVAVGLNGLEAPGSGNAAALEQALEDEKTVNAQLNERLRVLTQRQEADLKAVKEQSEATAKRMGELDLDLQKLRKANTELRQSNHDLREANAAGVGDPHLINNAMLSELEALRAARAADETEASTIIDALLPLLETTEPSKEENA